MTTVGIWIDNLVGGQAGEHTEREGKEDRRRKRDGNEGELERDDAAAITPAASSTLRAMKGKCNYCVIRKE